MDEIDGSRNLDKHIANFLNCFPDGNPDSPLDAAHLLRSEQALCSVYATEGSRD